jgi:DNA repair/transcription protein MET18/MMS19
MDGERDPRNLVIAFKTLKMMPRLLDVSKFIEDLFELLWCYFPITFKPPPNDPYAITTEELKRHLRECIASTPYFSKFTMPSLQEKLEHPSDTVKVSRFVVKLRFYAFWLKYIELQKEAIATLALCAPVYGAHALLPGISDIFNILTSQIFYAKDGDMQELALNAIHVITSTLATGISIAAISNPIERSLDPLIDECMVALKQPEHKNARSAIAILRSAASASGTLQISAIALF